MPRASVRLVGKEKELIPDPIERFVQRKNGKSFTLSLQEAETLKLGQRIVDIEINVDAKRR